MSKEEEDLSSWGPILFPGDNDVIFGRGGLTRDHAGNVRFRQVVKARRMLYIEPHTKARKNQVANEVFDIIVHSGGRFLKKFRSSKWMRTKNMWYKVDKKTALTKCKQALREKGPPTSRNHLNLQKSSKEKKEAKRNKRLPLLMSIGNSKNHGGTIVTSDDSGGDTSRSSMACTSSTSHSRGIKATREKANTQAAAPVPSLLPAKLHNKPCSLSFGKKVANAQDVDLDGHDRSNQGRRPLTPDLSSEQVLDVLPWDHTLTRLIHPTLQDLQASANYAATLWSK